MFICVFEYRGKVKLPPQHLPIIHLIQLNIYSTQKLSETRIDISNIRKPISNQLPIFAQASNMKTFPFT